jgi:integrase
LLYDTFEKNYDTKRIYKVNQTYYYRRKINNKLYRISLHTNNLKTCLQRKKLFDIMSKEEFMFSLELGDYKYVFEYETIQELREQLEITKATHEDIIAIEKQYKKVDEALISSRNKKEHITFALLELQFVDSLRLLKEETNRSVSLASHRAYGTTFKRLKGFFKDTNINNLSNNDFKEFRTYLKSKDLNPKTINNNMIYVSKFLDFAKSKNLINENCSKMVSIKEVTKIKENFTKKDLENIFAYDYSPYYHNILIILAHTGMRIGELWSIKKEDIIEDEGIYCFDLKESKTDTGIRKIPIHKDILDMVLNFDFPISKKTLNAFNKEILIQLYMVIPKESTKSLHTFRANFVNQLINLYPDRVEVIQEIVGHSKNDDKKLTIQTYGKGFATKLKKEMIDSITII